jgi:dTDP-4-dehydrorhamnose reductase
VPARRAPNAENLDATLGRMRILVIGENGQLGHELCSLLAEKHDLHAPPRSELDLADPDRLARTVAGARPEIIVNTAAWNDVDGAERDPDGALRINRDAVRKLGELAIEHRAALIHYSTDFVFDGSKGSPYLETDAPNPLGAYGRSKLAGEQALLETNAPALILRTAWVYSLRRKSFVSSILRLARERPELRIVDDQVGNPTYAADLAKATADLIAKLGADPHAAATEHRGLYHLAGTGSCSRFDFARSILELDPFREEHVVRALVPVASSEFPMPARRPTNAPLDCTKIARRLDVLMPHWGDGLARALAHGPG